MVTSVSEDLLPPSSGLKWPHNPEDHSFHRSKTFRSYTYVLLYPSCFHRHRSCVIKQNQQDWKGLIEHWVCFIIWLSYSVCHQKGLSAGLPEPPGLGAFYFVTISKVVEPGRLLPEERTCFYRYLSLTVDIIVGMTGIKPRPVSSFIPSMLWTIFLIWITLEFYTANGRKFSTVFCEVKVCFAFHECRYIEVTIDTIILYEQKEHFCWL